MFDLPVKEKVQRREYATFRKRLLELGFLRIQFSVYALFCASEEASLAKRRHVRASLPPQGQVRLISFTDKQFAAMEVYLGKAATAPEEPLSQGLLF